MEYIANDENLLVKIEAQGPIQDQVHLFSQLEIGAINAALAVGRPLLVRGEPGTGKSQLARAAAKRLRRVFLQHVVDSQTEARDLLWRLDSLARLAEAQLAGAQGGENPDTIRKRLAIENFVHPGPLWWAFDWSGALDQLKQSGGSAPDQAADALPERGSVLLIDEIDKAETEVPNGLLESLGAGRFTPPGDLKPVSPKHGFPAPLVIITTNESRALPEPFLRRCLVLHLKLPEGPELVNLLVKRGEAHFPGSDPDVLEEAARQVVEDRERALRQKQRAFPGQAEYFDLLRAVTTLHDKDVGAQKAALKAISIYVSKKHEVNN